MKYVLKHKEIDVTMFDGNNHVDLKLHRLVTHDEKVKFVIYTEYGPCEVNIGDYIVSATQHSPRQVISKETLDEFYEKEFVPQWAQTPEPQTLLVTSDALTKMPSPPDAPHNIDFGGKGQ